MGKDECALALQRVQYLGWEYARKNRRDGGLDRVGELGLVAIGFVAGIGVGAVAGATFAHVAQAVA